MAEHPDDFAPYMEDDETFESYCKRMHKVQLHTKDRPSYQNTSTDPSFLSLTFACQSQIQKQVEAPSHQYWPHIGVGR